MLIPCPPYLPPEYRIKHVTERWEKREAASLRRAVFCQEQGLFEGSDADLIDHSATTIVAVSCVFGMPEQVVGTVRIHQSQPGVWHGSRLAVHPDYRRMAALGSALIRMAVGTAHGRGAQQFLAQVQSQNVLLFQRLHWQVLEAITVCGMPHHSMQASLAHYPPCHWGEIGLVTTLRQAA
jgi:putative N-acetyltransferase (TIGR04045 family)